MWFLSSKGHRVAEKETQIKIQAFEKKWNIMGAKLIIMLCTQHTHIYAIYVTYMMYIL